MMALMRRLIRNSYLYRILLWSFLIMMGIGGGLLVNLGQEKNWVIKVYDNLLSEDKFQMVLKSAKHQQEEFRRKGIAIAGKNLEKDAVSGAVAGLLGEHVMDSLSLNVPDQLIEQGMKQHLGQLPSYFFKGEELDLEMFKRYMAPYTIDDFVDDIYLEKKNKLLYELVDLSIYTPEFELAMQYNIDFATKSYSVIKLPLQKYVDQARKHEPSSETLAKFYKKSKNNEEFKTAERRAGTIWTFDQSTYGVNISESDIKSHYEKNKHKYLLSPSEIQVRVLLIKSVAGKESEAKEKIESLHKEAEKNPKEFEALVKKFSQEDSASKGGLTGFFTQDTKDYDKVLVKTAFESLSKPDQISSPIKTERGYELVQLVKRNPAKYKDVKEVQADIKKELATTKFKQRFGQDAGRVINQAKYNPEVLRTFIERHKGEKKEIPLDSQQTGVIAQHLFKLEAQRYSTFFDKGNGVILLCTEIEKSVIPPLDSVKKKVLAKYYEQEGKNLLDTALADAFKEAQSGKFENAAQKLGESVQSATFEYKDGSVKQSPVLKGAAVQSKLKALHNPGSVAKAMTDSEGILIKLDDVSGRDEDLFKDQKDKLSKTMFYSKKYQVKEGFIASLYRHAKLDNKIHMKDEVLRLIKEA